MIKIQIKKAKTPIWLYAIKTSFVIKIRDYCKNSSIKKTWRISNSKSVLKLPNKLWNSLPPNNSAIPCLNKFTKSYSKSKICNSTKSLITSHTFRNLILFSSRMTFKMTMCLTGWTIKLSLNLLTKEAFLSSTMNGSLRDKTTKANSFNSKTNPKFSHSMKS